MNVIYPLTKRLRNIGISQSDSRRWARNVQKNINEQGLENSISYLKRVGDCIIWALTGSGNKPTWVKTRNRYPVIFSGLDQYDEEVQIRVSKIARALVLSTPSGSQVRKVYSAVVRPYEGTPEGLQIARSLIILGTTYLTSQVYPGSLTNYPLVGRQFRRIQSVSGKTPLIQQPPVLDSLRILADMPFLRDCPEWEKVLYPLHPGWIRDNLSLFQSSWPLNHVGEIHATQEGGGKLRMFASPYTVVQCLLAPSHNFFDYFRSQLPTDCTYNQESGALEAYKRLREGKTVHSVDLSTATCRFPWELQSDLAVFLGFPKELLTVLEKVSHGQWKVGKELRPSFNTKSLRWEVGQPLGIRPSMSLFSLAHNLLLGGICFRCDVDPIDTFRVLGDDVVIFDDHVHQMYLSVMQGIGVPISWNKSHSGNTFAEFAGFSITKNGFYRPGQWRKAEISNALSLAIQYKRPLHGEAPMSIIKAQKLWLFRHGYYQPSVLEISKYIRANTILDDSIVKWMKSESEYWYYAVMRIYQDSIRKYLKKYHLMVPFEYETPSAKALLIRGNSDKQLDEIVENVNNRIQLCSMMANNIAYCANEARGVLEFYRDSGLLSPEDALELIMEVYAKANTALYQPPSDLVIGGSPTLKAVQSAIDAVGGIA